MSGSAPFLDKVFFEDFDDDETFVFGAYEMTAVEMIAFAKAYDPEPFHVDEAAAIDAGWGRLIASGPLIGAIWRRLSKDAFPATKTVISPGWDEIRWTRPVYDGDVLSSHSHILSTRLLDSRPGEGLIRLSNEMRRQDGDTVMTMISNWFVRRRSDGS
jgi:acyl dehydratase